MTAFYPLLTVGSIVLFVWLARRFAISRNRNVLIWGIAGAILPPTLLVLYFLGPVENDETEEEPA